MKTMRKIFALMLALLLLLAGCSSKPKIDPQYYEAGKQALAIAEAYLADRIDLAEAKSRAAQLEETLDALPLLSEKDPAFEQSDKVLLYANSICSRFYMQGSDKYDAALRQELEKIVKYLPGILGLS